MTTTSREIAMAEHINGRLYLEQLGKTGHPVVFLHPIPMDNIAWMYQMAHLSTWFRCIGIDAPGYGRSPTARPGLTMTDIAQACWEAVDEITDDPAILVGCSLGSALTFHMANQRPDRTSAIVVSGASYRPVKPPIHQRVPTYQERGLEFRYQHALEDYSPAFRETEMGQYFARTLAERNPWADLSTILEVFRAANIPDPEWFHTGIKAPVLIITGSLDNAHQGAFALQARVPDCELVTIEGAGHACNMEKPWEWDAYCLAFLAKRGLLPR
jgi:pimeloyl-ACP methyl ester carboxylesterase